MQLAREVLDKEIVDCDGFKAGKVDNIVLELREGEHPIVRGIITQQGALAALFGTTVGRLADWARKEILGQAEEAEPITIGWEHVTRIDVVVGIDLDRWKAGLMRSEQAVWERWIKHLPFARR